MLTSRPLLAACFYVDVFAATVAMPYENTGPEGKVDHFFDGIPFAAEISANLVCHSMPSVGGIKLASGIALVPAMPGSCMDGLTDGVALTVRSWIFASDSALADSGHLEVACASPCDMLEDLDCDPVVHLNWMSNTERTCRKSAAEAIQTENRCVCDICRRGSAKSFMPWDLCFTAAAVRNFCAAFLFAGCPKCHCLY